MRKEDIDFILTQLLDSQRGVSDINISVGRPFQVEAHGKLVPVDVQPSCRSLTPYQTETFAMVLLQGSVSLTKTLLKTGSCDCSYQLGNHARFRVNIFSQRGNYSIVLRKLSTEIPSIFDLNLPAPFYKMSEEKNGLILVTGPTGSGKSTSLAALLRYINETQEVHVVTLEDPIEFEHKHQKATFNQRELGLDFDQFASGLRAALRQAPKVILVGEMRDRETVEIGLTAAETGHLVLSTLHTINAGQTINRIVGLFDKEEQELIRKRLSETIKWIACQRLLPKQGGGRVAAIEILAQTLRTSDLIANGETENKQFYDVLATGAPYGMRNFDQHILELFEHYFIDEKTALNYCTRKSATSQGMDRIKTKRGEQTSGLSGLEMQRDLEEEYSKGKLSHDEYLRLKEREGIEQEAQTALSATPPIPLHPGFAPKSLPATAPLPIPPPLQITPMAQTTPLSTRFPHQSPQTLPQTLPPTLAPQMGVPSALPPIALPPTQQTLSKTSKSVWGELADLKMDEEE
jgi:twitching motility protein PilT